VVVVGEARVTHPVFEQVVNSRSAPPIAPDAHCLPFVSSP
jgi:hypothetical protein